MVGILVSLYFLGIGIPCVFRLFIVIDVVFIGSGRSWLLLNVRGKWRIEMMIS